MGKLKTLKPRIKPAAPRIGFAQGDAKAADRSRKKQAPGHQWYGTVEWKALRIACFVRDNFTCQRTGEPVLGKHPAPNSPVANHKVPHRGRRELFFDLDNLETVAKHVHDKEVQREEQGIPTGVWD